MKKIPASLLVLCTLAVPLMASALISDISISRSMSNRHTRDQIVFYASPLSGKAALSVTFTIGRGDDEEMYKFIADAPAVLLDFGDGSSKVHVLCDVSNNSFSGTCSPLKRIDHIYDAPGTYTATLTSEGGFCPAPGCPITTLASVIVRVSGSRIDRCPLLPLAYPHCENGEPIPVYNQRKCLVGFQCPIARPTL